MDGKKDFFISYNKADRDWAEWIAWQLETAKYSTIVQAWDFRPGNNFVSEMQEGTVQAERTIAILSPDYMSSGFTIAEWNSAFAQDPTGVNRKLIPIRVKKFQPEGLFGQIIYIDLVGLTENDAKQALLTGVTPGCRLKPQRAPVFPGQSPFTSTVKPIFPLEPKAGSIAEVEIPPLKKLTDTEKLNFIQKSYQEIHQLFKEFLDQMRTKHPNFTYIFEEITTQKCGFKIFMDGEFKTGFTIWLGNSFGRKFAQICFSFGIVLDNSLDNSINETVSLDVNDKNEMKLKMGMNMFDDKHADNPEDIVRELWRRHMAYYFRAR